MVVQYFQIQTFSSIHQNIGTLWIQEIASAINDNQRISTFTHTTHAHNICTYTLHIRTHEHNEMQNRNA
jgi:hypothetical protein